MFDNFSLCECNRNEFLSDSFDQAYTKVIEDTVQEAFGSVGIHFIAKNFAMGKKV